MYIHAIGRNNTTNGIPIFSQSVKRISGELGSNSWAVLTKTKFGGVPTKVPVPPMLAE